MTPPRKLILDSSLDSIKKCAKLLELGELVAVPTETVYGLAANALSEQAVRKIFSVKGRPLIDPLITHFKSAESAFSHVHSSEPAEALASAFWPGPLTLVLEKRPIIPDLVTAGLSTAAIRVPNQPLMQALLREIDFPLAAPSANPFGYVSPTRPEHVAETLGRSIAAILDGGPCHHGIESTVLDLRHPHLPKILRPGPISIRQIEEALGQKITSAQASASIQQAQISPGQLSKHYSPHTKIKIVAHGALDFVFKEGEAIVANKKPPISQDEHVFWLSENGELEVVARNFFDLIQKLDRMPYSSLIIEEAPEEGLGIAINDRLRRAASPS
ncbi:MAG: L-threonylcarbamoyladenylate synthase [Opitutales bacterium]